MSATALAKFVIGVGSAIAFQPVEHIGHAFVAEDIESAGARIIDGSQVTIEPAVIPAFSGAGLISCNQEGGAVFSTDAKHGILFIHVPCQCRGGKLGQAIQKHKYSGPFHVCNCSLGDGLYSGCRSGCVQA